MHRRTLLTGGLVTALGGWALGPQALAAATAADPAEPLLAQAAACQARAQQRIREAACGVEHAALEPLARGFAGLAVIELLMDTPAALQAHPRVQALALHSLRALGRALRRTRRLLRQAPELPLDLTGRWLDAFEADLRATREGARAERATAGLRRLRRELEHAGPQRALHTLGRRLDRALDLGRRAAAEGGWGLLESADPALAEAVRGAPPRRPRPSPEVLLAGILAGALVVSGLVLFGFGAIQTSECLCTAIPIMLAGLLVLVAGGLLMQWAQRRHALEGQQHPTPPVPVPVQPGVRAPAPAAAPGPGPAPRPAGSSAE